MAVLRHQQVSRPDLGVSTRLALVDFLLIFTRHSETPAVVHYGSQPLDDGGIGDLLGVSPLMSLRKPLDQALSLVELTLAPDVDLLFVEYVFIDPLVEVVVPIALGHEWVFVLAPLMAQLIEGGIVELESALPLLYSSLVDPLETAFSWSRRSFWETFVSL